MALAIYCQDCGSPTQYTAKIPLFCCSCGQPFNKTTTRASVKPPTVSRPAPIIPKKRRIIEEAEIEEDDTEDEIDDNEDYGFEDDHRDDGGAIEPISEAEIDQYVEIEVAPPKKLKIEDIARGDEKSKPVPFKNGKAPKISKKEFQQQWEKEAGTLRKGNR